MSETIIISAPDDEPGPDQDPIPGLAFKVGELSAAMTTLAGRVEALEQRTESAHSFAETAVGIALDASEDAHETGEEVSELQDELLDAVTEVAEEELATEEVQDTVTIVVEEKPTDDEPEHSHWLTRPFASWKSKGRS